MDALVFEDGDPGPDEDQRVQVQPVSLVYAEEKKVVKTLLDSLTLKDQALRWAGPG